MNHENYTHISTFVLHVLARLHVSMKIYVRRCLPAKTEGLKNFTLYVCGCGKGSTDYNVQHVHVADVYEYKLNVFGPISRYIKQQHLKK